MATMTIGVKETTFINGINGFSPAAFAKNCTAKGESMPKTVQVDEDLLNKIKELLSKFGGIGANAQSSSLTMARIEINSGYRTSKKETELTGSKNPKSQHMQGKAVDIKIYNSNGELVPSYYIVPFAEKLGFGGIAIINNNSIHLDTRVGSTYRGDETDTTNRWGNIPSTWNSLTLYVTRKFPFDAGQIGRYASATATSEILNYMGTSSVLGSNASLNGTPLILAATQNALGMSAVQNTANAESGETSVIDEEFIKSIQDSISETVDQSMRGMRFMANTSRFFGAPFSFLESTDPPIDFEDPNGKEWTEGRTFAKHICAEAPLVHFIPGLPSYLSDFNTSTVNAMKEYVNEKSNGNELADEILKAVEGTEGRFFNFIPAYKDYIKYVNLLCRTAAIYMGIGDKKFPGTDIPYKFYNYDNYQNFGVGGKANEFFNDIEYGNDMSLVPDGTMYAVKNALNELKGDIFGGQESVKCYVDAGSSFSESLSNSTGQSQIAGMLDTGESIAKELDFWTTGIGGVGGATKDILSSIGGAIGELTDGLLSAFGLGDTNIANVTSYAEYIISGSNIVFPDMWQDSSYSKSYRFTLDLISPYGDDESVFLNLIMPLMFIIALTAPRQTSANSYASPFLVRVVSKGWFSCDMGIIDSIDIEKGGSDAWNASGMPLTLKVGISVKDMYSAMSIPSSSQPGLFYNNSGLIEFLAATCGVDTIVPNLTLKINTILNILGNMATDIPDNIYNKVVQGLNNTVMRWTKLF